MILYDTCKSGAAAGIRDTADRFRLAEAVDKLSRGTGRWIITASREDGLAYEGLAAAGGQFGAFTYAVLTGLDAAADENGDVTVGRLGDYVTEQLGSLSERDQVPRMTNRGGATPFPLVRATAVKAVTGGYVPREPTHVVIDPGAVRALVDGACAVDAPLLALERGFQVRLLERDAALAPIAREGRIIGCVLGGEDALIGLH